MSISLFVCLLILLQFICLWASKKSSSGMEDQQDYFLASKDVRFFPLLMTFIATQIGGGLVLGAAEEAYQFGWLVLLYPLGACLGFVVLALGIGKRLARFPVSTVAELLEVVYGSTLLKKAASLLSIISLFMILIAQVIASRKFMGSLGVDNSFFFLAFWAIVIAYTVMGGLKAVVSIDIIQAVFFIVVFALGLGYILYTGSFHFIEIVEAGWRGDAFDFNSNKLSGWLLMPLLFMVIEQDMAQRCFAASSPRIVTKAAAYAALSTFLVSIIPVFIGILGKQTGVVVPLGSSVFMDVAQAFTNPYIAAIIACAVLMAVLSTAISLLNAVSSNLSQDFNFIVKKGERALQFSKRMTAGIGLLAVGGSFFAGEIVALLIQSYELSVYCLFIPVCVALFRPKGEALSAWMALIFGAAGFCMTRMIVFDLVPKEVICLSLSGAGYIFAKMWIKSTSAFSLVEK
ncbi:MAG: sodium:solute symporter [Parachlamydiaceae bacterium]